MGMKYIVGGIVIFLWGLFMFRSPYKFWEFFESWKNSSNAEPSKFYLVETRIGGGICMLVGLIVVVCSFLII